MEQLPQHSGDLNPNITLGRMWLPRCRLQAVPGASLRLRVTVASPAGAVLWSGHWAARWSRLCGIRNASRKAKVLCGYCKGKNPNPPLHGRRGRPEAMFNWGRAGIPMEEKVSLGFFFLLQLQMLTERSVEPWQQEREWVCLGDASSHAVEGMEVERKWQVTVIRDFLLQRDEGTCLPIILVCSLPEPISSMLLVSGAGLCFLYGNRTLFEEWGLLGKDRMHLMTIVFADRVANLV